jgi:hypothetical protein
VKKDVRINKPCKGAISIHKKEIKNKDIPFRYHYQLLRPYRAKKF